VVKQVLVTAWLDKLAVRAKVDVNHLVKVDANQSQKPTEAQVPQVT